MKYFISDLHLSKSGVNKVSGIDSQLHNQFVSTVWNNFITDDDEVYIVGGVGDLSLLSMLNGNKLVLLGKSDMDTFNQYISSVSTKRDAVLDKGMYQTYCKNEFNVQVLFRDTLEVTLCTNEIIRLCVDYENATTSKMFTLASGIGNYQRLFGSGMNLSSFVNGYKPVSEYDIISSIRRGSDELLY